ncbi:MAG TPA: flagellar biosynthetic protein FliO [Polyangiaceae bacterium]|jgi:flagellar protein FliO/FliZ
MIRAGRRWTFAAILVAGAATALTGEAFALEGPAPAIAPVDAPPPMLAADPVASATPLPATPLLATPLLVRPKPIALAPESSDSGLGWKIVAFMAIVGGAAYYMRKRVRPSVLADDGRLTIVRRTSIGIRSELLVVNVEGQRLLIGVTPNSIQSLAILDADGPEPARAADDDLPAGSGSTTVGERFAAMLQAADARPPAASASARTEAALAEDEATMAGQARGLLALRRRG